jgi:hypothetical protein
MLYSILFSDVISSSLVDRYHSAQEPAASTLLAGHTAEDSNLNMHLNITFYRQNQLRENNINND